MTHHPISRNAKCPCGSGKKYKQCCLRKGYTYEEENGVIRRSVPMSDEVGDMLQQHLEALTDELGHEPGPEDALFPNLQLEHAEHGIAEGMKAAGVDPAFVYAFEQTGILVSEDNQHLLSDKDLAEWQNAIDHYRARHAEPDSQFPVGAVAFYGPDDTRTTKIVASVFPSADSEPILERFLGTDIAGDERVNQQIMEFFQEHKVTNVVATEKNIGCPHEEGEDFPLGEDCPFCPYWKGKQGSAAGTGEEEMSEEEVKMAMELMQRMDPAALGEMMKLAQQSVDADAFANMIMVGPCPHCDSENTAECEDDPEIEDASIGRCKDCGQLWCCLCEEVFDGAEEAIVHDCPLFEATEDDLDEPF